MPTTYWSKLETGRPSKWYSPHPAATNEPTPVLEGADKLKQQLGLHSMAPSSAGDGGSAGSGSSDRALTLFSYMRPRDGLDSDGEEEGGDDGSASKGTASPHPQFASDATNPYAEASSDVLRSGSRRGDHRPIYGNLTIAVGADEDTQSASSPSVAQTLAHSEVVLSHVLTKMFGAAAHITRMNGGPLVTAGDGQGKGDANFATSPRRAVDSRNGGGGALGGFIRNVPQAHHGEVNAGDDDDTESPAAVRLRSQQLLLSAARKDAMSSLVLSNPMGALGLTARLLYEAHMRTLATTVHVEPTASSSGGRQSQSSSFTIAGRCLATAKAIDCLRMIQHSHHDAGGGAGSKQGYLSAHFTQYLMDTVTAFMSSSPEEVLGGEEEAGGRARTVPIPPYMLAFFVRPPQPHQGGPSLGGYTYDGYGAAAGGASGRTLFEEGHAALKALLCGQLRDEQKSVDTIALEGALAEDDGLSVGHGMRNTTSSGGMARVALSDDTIRTNAVPIHPLLFAAPAVPLFPGAPCGLPASCVRHTTDGMGGASVPFHKPSKLLADTSSRELADLKGVPSYYGPTLVDSRTNDLVWGLARAQQLVIANDASHNYAPHGDGAAMGSATNPMLNYPAAIDKDGNSATAYGAMLGPLSDRLRACLQSLPPSAVSALSPPPSTMAADGNADKSVAMLPGQTSATMVLHYMKLLLKSIFTRWGVLDPVTRLPLPIATTIEGEEADSDSDLDVFPSDDDDEEDEKDSTTNIHGLAGPALLSVLGGGCRFIAVHCFTATPNVSTSSSSASCSSSLSLQGGLSAVMGRHFYFAQLSHYDRLLQAVLAKSMAAAQLKLNLQQQQQHGSTSAPPPAASDARSTLADAEEDLEDALADLGALEVLLRDRGANAVIEEVKNGHGRSNAQPSGSADQQRPGAPLSAYVVRNLSTDHPSHPRMDLVVMAMGAEGHTVAVMGFPSTASPNEPNAATTALEGIVEAMSGVSGDVLCTAARLSKAVRTHAASMASASVAGRNAAAAQTSGNKEAIEKEDDDAYSAYGVRRHDADDAGDFDDDEIASDSSSDDDLTIEEVRQGHNPCGGSHHAKAMLALLASTDGAKSSKKKKGSGLCGTSCCAEDDDEPSVGFPYGREPSVLALSEVLLTAPPSASSSSSLSSLANSAQRLRRHGIVKRRRTRLLALADAEEVVEDCRRRDKVRALNAANNTLDRLHSNSKGGVPRFIVDPSVHWSPMSLAADRPTACSAVYGLRDRVKAYRAQLAHEGTAALRAPSASQAAAVSREQRRLAVQWDADGYQKALRKSVLLEQQAAREELSALRSRIERIENSGELQRRARYRPSSSSDASAGATNRNTVPVWGGAASAATRDEALHRLYDKLVRRERFLSLLVLAKPWRATKLAEPVAVAKGGTDATAMLMLPASPSDMLTELFRYAAKCDRAARQFYTLRGVGSKGANGGVVASSSAAARITMAAATGSTSRSLYSSSIGPLLKGLLTAANVTRNGTMGGLPTGAGVAADVCERCLVGVDGTAAAYANYRHIHNYAATAVVTSPPTADASSRSTTTASSSCGVSIPIDTSSNPASSAATPTPLQRAMGRASLHCLHGMGMAGASGSEAVLGLLAAAGGEEDGADLEALGVISLQETTQRPSRSSLRPSHPSGSAALMRAQLAIAALAKVAAGQ